MNGKYNGNNGVVYTHSTLQCLQVVEVYIYCVRYVNIPEDIT